MVSKNTEDAIKAYDLVLTYETLVRSARRNIGVAEAFVPEAEKEFYQERKEEIRKIREGRDLEET